MNFALQQRFAKRRVIFGGCDAAQQRLGRIEHGFAMSSGAKIALRKLIHGFAGDALQNFAEQNETQVGVNRFRARRVFERLLANRGDQFALGMHREEIILVRGKPRRVRQQIADRDGFAPLGIRPGIPFGNVARHGQIEAKAARFNLHGHERRGDHGLVSEAAS